MKWDKNFLQLTFYKTIESCIIVNNCEANFPLFSFFFVQFSSFANYVFGMTDWLVAMDIMLCIDSYCVGNRFWIIWGITVETWENNDTNFFKVFFIEGFYFQLNLFLRFCWKMKFIVSIQVTAKKILRLPIIKIISLQKFSIITSIKFQSKANIIRQIIVIKISFPIILSQYRKKYIFNKEKFLQKNSWKSQHNYKYIKST